MQNVLLVGLRAAGSAGKMAIFLRQAESHFCVIEIFHRCTGKIVLVETESTSLWVEPFIAVRKILLSSG
jgi:hypothetical protein